MRGRGARSSCSTPRWGAVGVWCVRDRHFESQPCRGGKQRAKVAKFDVERNRVPRASSAETMSCSQSGAAGPPFAPGTQQDESSLLLRLRRWLPWEWYSIDGSGWCYNAEWDRMQRCAEMDVPADWNGVGAAPAPPWFGVEERGLLVAVLLSGAVLTCYAFRLWAAARGASGAAAPEMREWLRTAHAPPWAWEPGALLAAAGTLGGLLVGFLAPLALPTIRVTFESSG